MSDDADVAIPFSCAANCASGRSPGRWQSTESRLHTTKEGTIEVLATHSGNICSGKGRLCALLGGACEVESRRGETSQVPMRLPISYGGRRHHDGVDPQESSGRSTVNKPKRFTFVVQKRAAMRTYVHTERICRRAAPARGRPCLAACKMQCSAWLIVALCLVCSLFIHSCARAFDKVDGASRSIGCPVEAHLPTPDALVRSHAASRLIAGGTRALKNPSLQPPAFSGRLASRVQRGYIILPWQLGEPELAFTSPEDFFADILVPRVADRRELVIDVGANTGQFAVSIARSGHDGISFEPAPSTCAELRRNLESALHERERLAGTVSPTTRNTVHCNAVGRTNGSIPFRTATTNATLHGPRRTSASFGRAHASSRDAASDAKKRQQPGVQVVRQVTLDEVIDEHAQPLLLKSDTQGFELAVLGGAARLLKRRVARFLLIELSHLLLKSAGASPRQLLDALATSGYDCTMLAFWGPYISQSANVVQYKHLPLPRELRCRADGVLSFDELSALLARVPPTNRSGWTDLLCWPTNG